VRIVPQPDQAGPKARDLGLHQQISDFLEWIKPYREIFLLGVALLAGISGAVGWVAAHFATREQLSYLDCRVTNRLHTQLIGRKRDLIAAGLEWRMSQIRQMTVEEQRPAGPTLARLQQEIGDLHRMQADSMGDMEKALEEVSKGCPSDSGSSAKE
jgi:hypothetical protein